LLKPGKGRAAIVVPQSILNNPGLSYVRRWLLTHTRILGVIELPVETFLMSGREGTGTLTALLVVERRELNDVAAMLGGQPLDSYPIFMALAHCVGYTRRGKTLYRRNKDGTDVIIDVPIVNSTTGEVRITKERVVANDLPSIVREYMQFRAKVKKGQVYYDGSEGVYRVLQ